MPPGPETPEYSGDVIFSLYERQDRIYTRLDRKITKLGKRVTALEERGRSP